MKSTIKRYPQLQGFFQFPDFNHIQKDCLPKIMNGEDNLVLSAPTSSGKTVLFQIAILKYSHLPSPFCLYLAPIKSLCHEKYNQWTTKFRSKLTIAQVTGDITENSNDKFLHSHITIGTPQKLDYLSRQSLQYLKKIRLLLIDEIHMLNFQERGATLQAIVSRIMSLNNKVRILAVSATIPNIYQVAEWLKVPNDSVCIYGQQCRPVPLKKVVLGFKNTGNPFTFEGSLNYKLLEIIRSYSDQKGSLIFCPTQKGTEAACRMIISQMRQREFIENDKQLVSLIQATKQVLNSALQTMLPQGIAFHNASLSLQDRAIVQRLFLELKIKVLCTTSTLSMGINLPARLVIIKSTQCYRGSMKGYQEYTKIQTDQMMGRAGRPPFDTEGTVVIMTEKNNYNRYNKSQLFCHLLQHLNAEISLGSITSLLDVQQYFFNSFCYIRMQKSPAAYGIKGDVKDFVVKECLKAVQTLTQLKIINFFAETQRVSPRPLSNSISRSAVEVKSIITMSSASRQIVSQREYLFALCRCEQIGRYTSKVDQRKLLKELNQLNKFVLKQAISNCQKKSFVLIQAQLSNRHIQFWEMRRQAVEIVQLVRRLNYCVKTLGLQLKNFWLYYWSARYQKYLSEKFWEAAEGMVLTQLTGLEDKGKMLALRGIRTVNQLKKNIDSIGTWLQKGQSFMSTIASEIHTYEAGVSLLIRRDKSSDATSLVISFVQKFTSKFKGITICIGDSYNNLYYHKYINQQNLQVVVTFAKAGSAEYKIGILKQGIIGFDEFYLLQNESLTKFNIEQIQLKSGGGRRTVSALKSNTRESAYQKKSKSNQMSHKQKLKINYKKLKQIQLAKNVQNQLSNSDQETKHPLEHTSIVVPEKSSKQLKLPPNYKIKQPFQRRPLQQQQLLQKRIKKQSSFRYKPLNQYKWKPGFQQISSQESQKETKKSLRLVDRSKDKESLFAKKNANQLSKKRATVSKKKDQFLQFQYSNEEVTNKKKYSDPAHDDVFAYFYNMF